MATSVLAPIFYLGRAFGAEFVKVSITFAPERFGFEFSDNGQPLYLDPPGRVQVRWTTNAITHVAPWMPITSPIQTFAAPSVPFTSGPEFDLHLYPGVIATTERGRF